MFVYFEFFCDLGPLDQLKICKICWPQVIWHFPLYFVELADDFKEYGSHRFKLLKDPMTKNEAEVQCEKESGMKLVESENKKELQTFVQGNDFFL